MKFFIINYIKNWLLKNITLKSWGFQVKTPNPTNQIYLISLLILIIAKLPPQNPKIFPPQNLNSFTEEPIKSSR